MSLSRTRGKASGGSVFLQQKRFIGWDDKQLDDGLAMSCEKITYRIHAVQRMFERKITSEEVRYVLETGEVIEEYPDDTPYPSRLILGCYKGRLIHVVAANNLNDQEIIIITVYEPDPSEWDPDCKMRIS